MGAGVCAPPSADDPGPFEALRVSVEVTVAIAVAALVPLTAPVAVAINPAATPTTFVERATPARPSVALVRTGEPAVVDTACVTVWVRTLELAWATCVMVWVTLEAPAAPPAALLTVRVTSAVAVDVGEPASRVMFEAFLVVRVTAPVAVAAAPASACAGAVLVPGAGPAPLGVWLASWAAVVVAPTLFTASVVGAAAFGTVAVAAGGEAGGFCVAGVAGVVVVVCVAVAVVACAVEETSCVVVVTTLPRAPVAGVAAADGSATARVPGSAHRTAAVINRELRRPGSRGEGLRALPSISLDCGGFARIGALYTHSPPKSSQIAAL